MPRSPGRRAPIKLRRSCDPMVVLLRCFTSALMRGSSNPSPSGDAMTSTPRSGPTGLTVALKPIARSKLASSSSISWSSSWTILSFTRSRAFSCSERFDSSLTSSSLGSSASVALDLPSSAAWTSINISSVKRNRVNVLPKLFRVASFRSSLATCLSCHETLRRCGSSLDEFSKK